MTKMGRNDPCSCGSGKKYKQCCLKNQPVPGTPRKFKATWLSAKTSQDLVQRAFGQAKEEPKEDSEKNS